MVTVKNKFDTRQEIFEKDTPNDKYKKNSSLPTWKHQLGAYQSNQEPNVESNGSHKQLGKKRDKM